MFERYLSLIPSQYANKPKFRKYIEVCLRKIEEIYSVGVFWDSEFNIDFAVGKQLDIIGDIVGRSRYLQIDIVDVYFTWDNEGLGWEKGVWRAPYDPLTGLSRISDDIYRTVLKAKIVANQWDGTTNGIYHVYDQVFESQGTKVIVQDNQDMSMAVGIVGLETNPLNVTLLRLGYLFIKPTGVRINYFIYTNQPGDRLFSWDAESDRLSGWDDAAWGEEIKIGGA